MPNYSAFKTTTRLETKHAFREIRNIVHEVVQCTSKELNEFGNSFKQKSEEYMWEWILRACNNG